MKKLVIVRFQENPARVAELSQFLFENVIAQGTRPIAIPLPYCVVTNCQSNLSAERVSHLLAQQFPTLKLSVTEVVEEVVRQPLTLDKLLDIISEKGGVANLDAFEKAEMERLRAAS